MGYIRGHMKERIEQYEQRASEAHAQVKAVKRQLDVSALLRFVAFLAVLASIVFLFSGPPLWALSFPVIALTVFLLLVKSHQKLQNHRNFIAAIAAVNEEEINRLNYNHDGLPEGRAFIDPEHPYTSDLDIYGPGSIFQFVNRTASHEGAQTLAHWLANPASVDTIVARQQAVRELSENIAFREQFRARGLTAEEKAGTAKSLANWLNEEARFLPKQQLLRAQLIGLPILALLTLIGYGFGLPIEAFYAALLLNLVVCGRAHKAVSRVQATTEKQVQRFRKYALLITEIEQREFASALCATHRSALVSGQTSASAQLKKLTGILQNLDSLRNPFGWLLLNGIGLWNIRYALRLEAWKEAHKETLHQWLHALAEMDALQSMAGMAYNNADFCFPEPQTGFTYKAANLAHPLLHRGERVSNELHIRSWQHFFLITGSNMAGKSTFLRAVGVNQVLASAGAPVCASELLFAPVPLYSSMRIGDSIQARESTFYAELKRLRFIIEAAKGQPIFIILDEILKGTNSADKLTGSRALIEQLVKAGSAGLIATHDLDLATMEKEYPAHIQNVHFDVQIDVDNFHFDYKLKPGVCKTMNATQLMRNMGIELGNA